MVVTLFTLQKRSGGSRGTVRHTGTIDGEGAARSIRELDDPSQPLLPAHHLRDVSSGLLGHRSVLAGTIAPGATCILRASHGREYPQLASAMHPTR